MKPASAFNSMAELRAEIDAIDTQIVAMLARRGRLIGRAAEIKAAEGLPARIDERVAQVLDQVQAAAVREGLDPALAAEIWRQLIEWSIAAEEKAMATG